MFTGEIYSRDGKNKGYEKMLSMKIKQINHWHI